MKFFLCLTQRSTKFTLLINVEMPTILCILTFISMINTTSERFKARNIFICRYFSFDEQFKFHAQLSMKKIFITSVPVVSFLKSKFTNMPQVPKSCLQVHMIKGYEQSRHCQYYSLVQ